ncbi:MAG TPA: sn-glycerol-3-phosphate ABC transporter ATP-binding protein UgpC [Phycisphaeraceae bacterium]|nr:sn-glycerol-3-phosphate ABC transporter ATP-binding protein UgpC [Phycisphaeraceae bacterium]
MAKVVLQDVQKVYPGNVTAVRDFSLTIEDGEFVVLVGPSGCGKSTTLRMIAGLEEITRGTISIGDRVVNDVHPKDRDIAMVFQNYALYPHMTVYKNMAFGLKLRKTPRQEIDRRVQEAAKILGITELLDRKPKALSGGQRQRVALGRAIVREPKAFLFDEPLSNLDAKLRVETRAELKALHHRLKTTTIYVTHDQEEAMTLGDRIIVMNKGVVQQVATPLQVYREPVNRFVAGFVGTPPMNFLSGRLEKRDGVISFIEGSSDPQGNPIIIRLPDEFRDQLENFTGREIVLGVRPEAMSETPPADHSETGNILPVTVRVIEPLGDTMDLICMTQKHEHIVTRVPARDGVRSGDQIRLYLETRRLHVFEPGEDSVNLVHPPARPAVTV